MPEYLAPDVYVEEIDTGSKPIEGVSTSTAGMLGVTERGPANVPILITSFGEYKLWFGGQLDPTSFVNPGNSQDLHCFLPHAIEGFFTNGGKRVYVARVQARGAARSEFSLHDGGTANSAATWLLRPAAELSGTALTVPPTPAYVVDINSPVGAALANGNHLRVGGGSESEYRDVGAAGVGAGPNHVPLNYPLARTHAAATTAHEITRTPIVIVPTPVLDVAAPAGATSINVRVGALGDIALNHLLEIGNDPLSAEHRYVVGVTTISAVPPIVLRVTLDSPLHVAHGDPAVVPPAINVFRLDPGPGAPDVANNTIQAGYDGGIGDRVVYLTLPFASFNTRSNLVIFERGAPALPNGTFPREARRIGVLSRLTLGFGAYDNYDAGSRVAGVTPVVVGTPRATTTDAFAGVNVVAIDNRVGIVQNAGMVLQIGAGAPFEYAPIAGVPNRSPGLAPPDAGQVQLAYPLQRTYPAGIQTVILQAPTVMATRPISVAALTAPARATTVVVTDGGDAVVADQYLNNDLVRIATPSGAPFYHQLSANSAAATALPITFTVPFARPHAAGSPVAERAALVLVQALDTGAWGNRLRVSVTDENPGLVSRTPVIIAIAPNRIRLASAAGIEPGTILELVDGNGVLLTTLKVMAIERATAEVTLDPAVLLTPAQVAALSAVPNAYIARSREFSLTVRLLGAPDPSAPGSGDTVLDREVFRNLSLDPRHSRYVQTVVGDIAGVPLRLSDRRPDGESWYVRVHDLAQDLPAGPPAAGPYRQDVLNSIRFGPEPLSDLLSDGRSQPARHPLAGGSDSMATLDDNAYIGADNVNPENRTGLFSLRNIEDISIVAVPGRTTTTMQNALINHCELARYRFAVLDANRPPRDAIADVINQRQQFDTKYAAIYHPWLLIPPPFPVSAAQPPEYAIPPSGHIVGVYARTDIERGVHKAPANEVVRGISGLQRLLNKGEHDILNPYPININVIRDFRPNSRGIRVYGGRVITSDSDWKYVNVRRLLIFIEASINRGLQWVVFEPNAEPLWARVRRSIANFLTLVWRNGALEGTKVEEAFFVKCDRTTMTQTDIDSGRLICYVGVAPVKPAEFVIVRIGLWTAHADD